MLITSFPSFNLHFLVFLRINLNNRTFKWLFLWYLHNWIRLIQDPIWFDLRQGSARISTLFHHTICIEVACASSNGMRIQQFVLLTRTSCYIFHTRQFVRVSLIVHISRSPSRIWCFMHVVTWLNLCLQIIDVVLKRLSSILLTKYVSITVTITHATVRIIESLSSWLSLSLRIAFASKHVWYPYRLH